MPRDPPVTMAIRFSVIPKAFPKTFRKPLEHGTASDSRDP
jgi:hypothetical protein